MIANRCWYFNTCKLHALCNVLWPMKGIVCLVHEFLASPKQLQVRVCVCVWGGGNTASVVAVVACTHIMCVPGVPRPEKLF